MKNERIVDLLRSQIAAFNHVSMPDVDELVMIIDSASETLPERFLKVSSGLEKFSSSYRADHLAICNRLLRILEVDVSLPNRIIPTLADELAPTFQLDADDKAKALELCSQMRKIVLAANQFDQPHKVRLGNRIAAMEAEIHKEKGKFDVILGGVSDLGETLGKFGVDIKQLTDRMSEITKITRSATKEYDQLPVPDEIKKLPPPSETEQE